MGTFDDNRRTLASARRRRSARVAFALDPPDRRHRAAPQGRPVPVRARRRGAARADCYEAYNIQVAGLEQRLRAIGSPKVVIGVSGGLDSTHALIVAAKAMDRLGRPRTDILGYTMPGFATGDDDQGQRDAARARRSA